MSITTGPSYYLYVMLSDDSLITVDTISLDQHKLYCTIVHLYDDVMVNNHPDIYLHLREDLYDKTRLLLQSAPSNLIKHPEEMTATPQVSKLGRLSNLWSQLTVSF